MSIVMKHVHSQESFAALDVREVVQNDDWTQRLVHHDAFSGIAPTKYEPLKLNKKLIDCEEENIRAILVLWDTYIACEVEKTKNGKTAACEQSTYSENVFEPLRRMNNSGPPTRFRRHGAI
jgi:hypothetical protein